MPHFGHVILLRIIEVKAEVLTDVLICVRTISSRSGNGRRVTRLLVGCMPADGGADVQTADDIDPDDPTNIAVLLAFDWAQVSPQSF